MHLGMWIGNKLDLREFFFPLKCFLRSYLECVCVCVCVMVNPYTFKGLSMHIFLVVFFFFILFSN